MTQTSLICIQISVHHTVLTMIPVRTTGHLVAAAMDIREEAQAIYMEQIFHKTVAGIRDKAQAIYTARTYHKITGIEEEVQATYTPTMRREGLPDIMSPGQALALKAHREILQDTTMTRAVHDPLAETGMQITNGMARHIIEAVGIMMIRGDRCGWR